MDNDDLDNNLRDYFLKAQISASSLEDILAESRKLQEGFESSPAKPSNTDSSFSLHSLIRRFFSQREHFNRIAIGLPTLAVFGLTAALVMQTGEFKKNTAEIDKNEVATLELSKLVLREAAINHRTKLQLDVRTSDVEVLQKSMGRLDFDLVLPEALTAGHELLGGRYCTLAGKLAAHLRLEDEGGTDSNLQINNAGLDQDSVRSRSLFVTRSTDENRQTMEMAEQFPESVHVSSWTQDGMLYVLAEGNETVSSVQ